MGSPKQDRAPLVAIIDEATEPGTTENTDSVHNLPSLRPSMASADRKITPRLGAAARGSDPPRLVASSTAPRTMTIARPTRLNMTPGSSTISAGPMAAGDRPQHSSTCPT